MSNYRIIEALFKKRKNIYSYLIPSASSEFNLKTNVTNIIYWDSGIHYHSLDSSGSYFIINFFKPVYVKEFIIKTSINRDPRNWVLEGSNDATNYVNLYTNSGTSSCGTWNSLGCTYRNEVQHEVTKPGNYINFRFRMTGVSSANDYYLVLFAIDFIGKILDFNRGCSLQRRHCSFLISYVLMIIYS